jgi:uncharacterized Zn-finger protein
MRVIEVHVADLDEFIDALDNLEKKMGSYLYIKTALEDPLWFYAFAIYPGVPIVLLLDYDVKSKMCKITIHTAQRSPKPDYEDRIVKYWEQYDVQMIEHNSPPIPPLPGKWSELIPCPFCDAKYNYPQLDVDEGAKVECPNCGKQFDL